MLGMLRNFDQGQLGNAAARASNLREQVDGLQQQVVDRRMEDYKARGADSMASLARDAAARARAIGDVDDNIVSLLEAYPSLNPDDQRRVQQYLAETAGPSLGQRMLNAKIGLNEALADKGMRGYLSRGTAYGSAGAGTVAGAAALMELMEGLQPGSTEGLA